MTADWRVVFGWLFDGRAAVVRSTLIKLDVCKKVPEMLPSFDSGGSILNSHSTAPRG